MWQLWFYQIPLGKVELGAWRNNGVLPSGNTVTEGSLYYCMFCISFSVILYFCLFIYERDFCDINHAQWRWGRGADLSTTRRPHINIRRIRGNLLLLNYPDENQSNKDWFIVGWEKSKLMNGNKHFGHLFSFSDFIKHLFHFHVVFDYVAFCQTPASLKMEAFNQNIARGTTDPGYWLF